MNSLSTRRPVAALLVSILVPLAGCGDDDADDSSMNELLLSADEAHYGKTYGEWAAAWALWANDYAPNDDPALDCKNPVADRTGATCALNQDADSPVFFLAGSFGEELTRDCTVPEGKALFFPLVNTWGDNAGVPEDMLLSEDDIRGYVEMVASGTDPERVWVRVDGVELQDAAQGVVTSAPYTMEIPAGDNAYVCNGVEGVEGSFDGFVGGYWAMLAPLSAGEHLVEFGLTRGPDPLSGDTLEVTLHYNLTIE